MKTLPMKTSNQGFSLIELLLVLGVIALLIVAAFVVYPQIRERNTVNTESQRIFRMVGTVRNLYENAISYNGLSTDAANAARAFTNEMNDGNTQPGQQILNSWGGEVTIAPAGVDNNMFAINYTAVPADSCIKLATGVLVNFERMEIPEGTVVYNKATGSQPNINAITNACVAGGDTVDMYFSTF